jgi:hypothetical protein
MIAFSVFANLYFSTPFWINYFLIDKAHSHYVYVFSTQKVLPKKILFSTSALIQHLFQIPFIQPFLFCFQNPLQILAKEFQPPHQMRVTNMPIDGIGLGFMVQIPFTQMGHDWQVHE